MNRFIKALAAGVAGALATTIVSKAARRGTHADPEREIALGAGIGLAVGLVTAAGQSRSSSADEPTERWPVIRASTVALSIVGGLCAGIAQRVLGGVELNDDYFKGKHIVVTGGSRGLGFALARRLLGAGARVTICGRSDEALRTAAQQLRSYGESVAAVRTDVRDQGDCERLISAATELNGSIDVLINVAGVIEVGPVVVQTIDDYREAMETHFWAPLYTTLAVLPAMRERGSGHIVNVASVGGVMGVPHLAPYCASKFAQVGLTQVLRAELAQENVKMTSIIPGLMITGSPEHAVFKGQNRAEYAWFTLSDANPLLSISADTAARRILRAIRRNQAQAVIGPTAKLAQLLNALVPETTASLLAYAAGLLPRAGGAGAVRRTGAQSHSAWTQNPLTWLNRAAAERNNQDIEARS